MLTHVVVLKFKADAAEDKIRRLERLLDDLPNRIKEIQMFEFGRNVVNSTRAYDFALVALFANPQSLERYQKHPDHLPVVELIHSLCESTITVDFPGTDAASLKDGPAAWERDPLDALKLKSL
jgi:hypothetical protein